MSASSENATGLGILVVEDEIAIQRGLCDVLAYHGHVPTAAATGEDGLREALAGDYALVLLDIMLPGISGFDVCRQLRAQRPDLPILMLTARGSEDDVLEGFRCGSDDYLTKPFSIRELTARINALLRRSGKLPTDRAEPFDFGEWCVTPDHGSASRGDESVELSKRELAMLALFHRERGRIVSRRLLLREVWGMSAADRVETRTVDMHIAKLRKKLRGGAASAIETVRGEGYRFAG
jgi:DNA-binding response OmpR family regulator